MSESDQDTVAIVGGLDEARAALAAAAGAPVTLVSPPGAAAYLGAGYFRALVEAARAEAPEVEIVALLDCAGDSGSALAALRAGLGVIFTGPEPAAARIADIAAQRGLPFRRAAPTP